MIFLSIYVFVFNAMFHGKMVEGCRKNEIEDFPYTYPRIPSLYFCR